jgi:hypothetical protein
MSGVDALIRTADFALLLGVEPRTLAAWRRRGIGPTPLRLTSRTLRYRGSGVLAGVEGRQGAQAPASVDTSKPASRGHFKTGQSSAARSGSVY